MIGRGDREGVMVMSRRKIKVREGDGEWMKRG